MKLYRCYIYFWHITGKKYRSLVRVFGVARIASSNRSLDCVYCCVLLPKICSLNFHTRIMLIRLAKFVLREAGYEGIFFNLASEIFISNFSRVFFSRCVTSLQEGRKETHTHIFCTITRVVTTDTNARKRTTKEHLYRSTQYVYVRFAEKKALCRRKFLRVVVNSKFSTAFTSRWLF